MVIPLQIVNIIFSIHQMSTSTTQRKLLLSMAMPFSFVGIAFRITISKYHLEMRQLINNIFNVDLILGRYKEIIFKKDSGLVQFLRRFDSWGKCEKNVTRYPSSWRSLLRSWIYSQMFGWAIKGLEPNFPCSYMYVRPVFVPLYFWLTRHSS